MKSLKICLIIFIVSVCLHLQSASSSSSSTSTTTSSSSSSSSSSSLSSSSSSSSSTNISLDERIKQELPFLQQEHHPEILGLITSYALPTLNTKDLMEEWVKWFVDTASKNTHLQTPPDRFPIAALEPAWVDYTNRTIVPFESLEERIKKVGFHVSDAAVVIHLFNKYEPHHTLTLRWDPKTQSLQLLNKASFPARFKSVVDFEYELYSRTEKYIFDTRLQIPAERPEIAVPQADGSLLHVAVLDHDPLKGGTTIVYYLETTKGFIPPWNLETLRYRTVIRPQSTSSSSSSSTTISKVSSASSSSSSAH